MLVCVISLNINSDGLCQLLKDKLCCLYVQENRLNLTFLFPAGCTSPQPDPLKKSSTLEQTVQAPPSAAPAPPAPVGQRSQTGAAASRPTSTAAGSQKPPDLLEQRKGKDTCWAYSGSFLHRRIYTVSEVVKVFIAGW